jgi:hypothetical protein
MSKSPTSPGIAIATSATNKRPKNRSAVAKILVKFQKVKSQISVRRAMRKHKRRSCLAYVARAQIPILTFRFLCWTLYGIDFRMRQFSGIVFVLCRFSIFYGINENLSNECLSPKGV